MKRILHLFEAFILMLPAVSCADAAWDNLLDKDLSRWRIYQSYRLPDNFSGARPVDQDGRTLQPIGYDKNVDNTFSVLMEDGEPVLKVTSGIYGSLVSDKSYRNFHLSMKVRFGKDSWPPRAGKAIDSGIIYNSVGEAGSDYWLTWMKGFEFQVMQSGTPEGVTGDFWPCAGTRADIRVRVDRERRGFVYDNSQEARTVGGGSRIGNCYAADFNSPEGEWTQLDLICFEGRSLHIVNGNVAMALDNLRCVENGVETALEEGRIQIQCEVAELYYKDIRIKELKRLPAKYEDCFE